MIAFHDPDDILSCCEEGDATERVSKTEECPWCRGEGELIITVDFSNGYHEKALCGECDGSGRVPKRSE